MVLVGVSRAIDKPLEGLILFAGDLKREQNLGIPKTFTDKQSPLRGLAYPWTARAQKNSYYDLDSR